eukprot:388843-Prymnesium_polylepis.1
MAVRVDQVCADLLVCSARRERLKQPQRIRRCPNALDHLSRLRRRKRPAPGSQAAAGVSDRERDKLGQHFDRVDFGERGRAHRRCCTGLRRASHVIVHRNISAGATEIAEIY